MRALRVPVGDGLAYWTVMRSPLLVTVGLLAVTLVGAAMIIPATASHNIRRESSWSNSH